MEWTSTADGLPGSPVFSFAVKGTTLFAGTGSGVYYTNDNGINWHRTNTPDVDIKALLIH